MLIVLLLCTGIDMIGDIPSRTIQIDEPAGITIPEEKIVIPEPEVTTPEEIKCSEESTKPEKKSRRKKIPAPKKEEKAVTEEMMIPFPEGDKLEPGEKEVEALDASEEGYKYYVYRSHSCAPCIWLVNELQKNVDEKDLILSYERTTKSGKYVTHVPVLEVYKDGKLVHQQTGYTSWKTIQGKLGEID